MLEDFIKTLNAGNNVYEDTIIGFYYKNHEKIKSLSPKLTLNEFMNMYIKIHNLIPTTVIHPAAGKMFLK